MSVFWQVLTILLFFEVPSVGQGPLPPPPHGREIENSPLKPAQQGGKWGYVDPTGKFIIAAQFDSADLFSEGAAAVELNKRFGYIGTDGHVAIQPKYFRAGPFKEGFAWVMTRKPWTPFGTGEYGFVARLGQGTFIDHSGREVRRPFPIAGISNFSEGLAAVRPGKVSEGYSGKVGYLNGDGKWSIKPQFDEAHDFSEGLAAVNQGAKGHMGGKWGYIDKDGTLVIPARYGYAGQFKNERACVEEAEHWKLIGTKGNATPVEKNECAP
jgi:hypothetical protein